MPPSHSLPGREAKASDGGSGNRVGGFHERNQVGGCVVRGLSQVGSPSLPVRLFYPEVRGRPKVDVVAKSAGGRTGWESVGDSPVGEETGARGGSVTIFESGLSAWAVGLLYQRSCSLSRRDSRRGKRETRVKRQKKQRKEERAMQRRPGVRGSK